MADTERLASIEAAIHDIRSAVIGPNDGSRLGLVARVTSLEAIMGRIVGLAFLSLGAVLTDFAIRYFGGKH